MCQHRKHVKPKLQISRAGSAQRRKQEPSDAIGAAMTDQVADTPLARYFRLVEAVAATAEGLGLSALAASVGLPVGTTHRLAAALCDVGVLARQDGSKVYRLGGRMTRLCHLVLSPGSVEALARPILRDLVSHHGETAYLARLSGGIVESMAMETPQADGQAYVQPGRIMPFHASAAAKAIFAFQPAEAIERLLAGPRARFTPDTRIGADEIRAEFARVRAEGFAVCDNELDPGVLGFAAPVEIGRLGVAFAVGLVGLSARLRQQPRAAIRDSLQQAGRRISSQIGLALPPEM